MQKTNKQTKKKPRGERKKIVSHFSEKVLFQFISVPLQGILQCTKRALFLLQSILVTLRTLLIAVKEEMPVTVFVCMLAEYILHIIDMNFSV